MKFSASLILAAAVGSFARPSGHAHLAAHRSLDKRLDFVKSDRPTPNAPAPANNPQPSPAPAVSSAPAPAPAPAPASSSAPSPTPSSSSGGSAPKAFCSGNSKRATAAQIGYVGNIGAPGNYLCNIMEVPSVQGYDYTMVIQNKAKQDQQCVYFTKIGKDGSSINGFFKDTGGKSFTLPAGGQTILAFEANTQGGVTCGVGQVQTTSFGQYAGTWIEFDFANTSNGGHSGADASCLVAADNDMSVQGAQVCSQGTCSTINQGGSGTNAYTKGTNDLDGVGLNLNPGPVSLEVTMN